MHYFTEPYYENETNKLLIEKYIDIADGEIGLKFQNKAKIVATLSDNFIKLKSLFTLASNSLGEFQNKLIDETKLIPQNERNTWTPSRELSSLYGQVRGKIQQADLEFKAQSHIINIGVF